MTEIVMWIGLPFLTSDARTEACSVFSDDETEIIKLKLNDLSLAAQDQIDLAEDMLDTGTLSAPSVVRCVDSYAKSARLAGCDRVKSPYTQTWALS